MVMGWHPPPPPSLAAFRNAVPQMQKSPQTATAHGSTCAGLGLAQPREGTRRLPAAPLRRQHRLQRAANAPASLHGPRCSPERGVRAGTALHLPAAAGEQLPCNSLGTPTDPHLCICMHL